MPRVGSGGEFSGQRSARESKRLTPQFREQGSGVVCVHGPSAGRVRMMRGASER